MSCNSRLQAHEHARKSEHVKVIVVAIASAAVYRIALIFNTNINLILIYP